MSLRLNETVYRRTKQVAPRFAPEFARVEVPLGTEWVTAWDVATVAVTWEYHLSNGARIDPKLIDGRLDRETGQVVPLTAKETYDLLAVFDRVRQHSEIRRDLRWLVQASR